MAERPIVTEAEARAECHRCGLNPDDWRRWGSGAKRVYVWQDVQQQMTAGLASTGATAMKIEWTDEACHEAQRAWNDAPYGGSDIRGWRVALEAACAEQFKPETDAEKVKRLEAVLLSLQLQVMHGSKEYHAIRQALSYSKGA